MPHTPTPPVHRHRARKMRRAMTDAELKLWNAVRAHRLEGLGFRRQFPIGPFIVDFACPDHRLVVELDGSQHADSLTAQKDKERTAWLEGKGWSVVRFWNDDVLKDIEGVCGHILAVVLAEH